MNISKQVAQNVFQHSILGTIPSFYQYSKPVRTAAMRASYFLKTNGAAREDFYAFIRENSPCRQRFIDLLLGTYSKIHRRLRAYLSLFLKVVGSDIYLEYDNYLIIKRQDEHEFKHFSGYSDCSLQIRKLYCEKIINEYLSAER